MSHVYGHSCVTLEVHMCQESLCCRRVCVSAVCSNEACVWIWPHISVGLCDYVCMCLSALSLGVSASVPECAFEWDCEFVWPSVSLCVFFRVGEHLDWFPRKTVHLWAFRVPSHGP